MVFTCGSLFAKNKNTVNSREENCAVDSTMIELHIADFETIIKAT